MSEAIAWITGMFIVGFVAYVSGRLVAAIVYVPLIDRVNRRNADLEHRLENMLDWESETMIDIARYEHRDRITQ